MNTLKTTILAAVWISGCSAFDYLQYRENTGLMTVEQPDGYGSARFGAVIAASSDADSDYAAVSAGAGQKTLIYQLADKGGLTAVENPIDQYPASADMTGRNPTTRGSGATIVGLPSWVDKKGASVSGCFAIGEPEVNQVTVYCASQSESYTDLPAPQGSGMTSLGQRMAGVRPRDGGQWLLAAAGETRFALFSSAEGESGRSDIAAVSQGEIIDGLAAGRVIVPNAEGASDVVYVAVGAVNKTANQYRVYLFAQAVEGSPLLEQVGCLEKGAEVGFGGTMTTGDLDRDGTDELVVSGGSVQGRADRVYIYDAAAAIQRAAASAPSACLGDGSASLPPMATISPSAGELDVACPSGCGFGTALAVGDIATDDGGAELVIGARDAEVGGVSEAGAVYIYRGWLRGIPTDPVAGPTVYNQFTLAGQVFDSAPNSQDSFGGSVQIAPMAGRNELIIGVSGTGKIVVAFCTGVGKDIEAGGDVTRDLLGKVVSTRCRM